MSCFMIPLMCNQCFKFNFILYFGSISKLGGFRSTRVNSPSLKLLSSNDVFSTSNTDIYHDFEQMIMNFVSNKRIKIVISISLYFCLSFWSRSSYPFFVYFELRFQPKITNVNRVQASNQPYSEKDINIGNSVLLELVHWQIDSQPICNKNITPPGLCGGVKKHFQFSLNKTNEISIQCFPSLWLYEHFLFVKFTDHNRKK